MTKKTEKNEVEKAAPQAITTMSPTAQRAQSEFKMNVRNILIPRILIMQPQSPQVLDEVRNKNPETRTTFGDLLETLDNTVLGNPEKPLLIIPFKSGSNWILREKMGEGKAKFVKFEEDTGEELPFIEEIGNKTFVRTYSINHYVLLPNEIEKGGAIPYLISFRSTSVRAGSKLNSIMYVKNKAAGRAPWASLIELSVSKTKNDKGVFAVLDVRQVQSRGSNEKELEACAYWYEQISSGKTVDQEIDEDIDTEATANTATSNKF